MSVLFVTAGISATVLRPSSSPARSSVAFLPAPEMHESRPHDNKHRGAVFVGACQTRKKGVKYDYLEFFMTQIILLLLGLVIALLLLSRKSRNAVAGICAIALDQTVRKNANKEKILALLSERGSMSNTEIREALGVSSRTAVRYMDQLEKEGRVEQADNTGRGVIYRLKS